MNTNHSNKLWLVAVAASLAATFVSADAAALDGAEWEIRSGTKLVGKGDADNRSTGAAVWCKDTSKGYFLTKTSDYTKDVPIYQEIKKGENVEQVHLYTLKANGDLRVVSTGKKRGQILQQTGVAGSSYKVTFRDEFGSLQGYAYWSPKSSGFFDAKDKPLGTFGSGTDRDMRMLAFFFFLGVPGYCT